MKKISIKLKIYITAAFACSCIGVHAMREAKVFAIPGQNGLGSSAAYVKKCLGDQGIAVTKVKTPSKGIDFGQNRCMKFLEDALSKDKSDNVIIHATSQGTATALNYLATQDKGQRIKAVILESVLISGNDAIDHTLKGDLTGMPLLKKIPCSYYLFPYLAKFVFPRYWPGGKQVIKTLKHIPNNIPIVIIHSRHDQQLSYRGALALYYGLKANGNNNVYLISKLGSRHINILKRDIFAQKTVQAILKKHKLAPKKISEVKKERANEKSVTIDAKTLQPNHVDDRFKKPYEDLYKKEKRHSLIQWSWITGGIIAAGVLVYSLAKKIGWY